MKRRSHDSFNPSGRGAGTRETDVYSTQCYEVQSPSGSIVPSGATWMPGAH